jgi:uncharacterized protein YfaT (DUF1175 family)
LTQAVVVPAPSWPEALSPADCAGTIEFASNERLDVSVARLLWARAEVSSAGTAVPQTAPDS